MPVQVQEFLTRGVPGDTALLSWNCGQTLDCSHPYVFLATLGRIAGYYHGMLQLSEQCSAPFCGNRSSADAQKPLETFYIPE
jgi:hypothetical protein